MTYEEVVEAVDQLSEEERLRLQQYLNAIVVNKPELKAGTMDVDLLLAAIGDMRRGLSESDIDEIVAAMNAFLE